MIEVGYTWISDPSPTPMRALWHYLTHPMKLYRRACHRKAHRAHQESLRRAAEVISRMVDQQIIDELQGITRHDDLVTNCEASDAKD